MKLLYVIQAYGREVFGGAETYARMMAERMAERGHEVHVITSCARTYYDWADFYEPGTEEIDGVTVHRLPVKEPRNHRLFGPLIARVLGGPRPSPLYIQERWLDMQGPYLPGFEDWMWENVTNYDAAIFFTYLYYPTARGLPLASGRIPTILHPLSHDEAPFFLSIFDSILKLPTGYVYTVPEDEALMRRRANPASASATIGIGVEQDVVGNGASFREAYDLGSDPYLVCLGRLDPAKGSEELFDFFVAYKERHPEPLKLVLVGEPVKDLPPHPDVVTTGFVPAQTKYDALAGALGSVHPSYYESFSMALTEAWAQSTPALVNGRCEVLAGQIERSGGGLSYRGFPEFEAAVELLVDEPHVAKQLGTNGRAYVEENYQWDYVMDRYERFIASVPSV